MCCQFMNRTPEKPRQAGQKVGVEDDLGVVLFERQVVGAGRVRFGHQGVGVGGVDPPGHDHPDVAHIVLRVSGHHVQFDAGGGVNVDQIPPRSRRHQPGRPPAVGQSPLPLIQHHVTAPRPGRQRPPQDGGPGHLTRQQRPHPPLRVHIQRPPIIPLVWRPIRRPRHPRHPRRRHLEHIHQRPLRIIGEEPQIRPHKRRRRQTRTPSILGEDWAGEACGQEHQADDGGEVAGLGAHGPSLRWSVWSGSPRESARSHIFLN